MADKELTVFVVDAHPKAFPGYTYLFDVLAGKLLRGLKTDSFSLVAFHATSTNHKLADKGVFPGIDVQVDFETPSFEALQSLKSNLVSNDDWSSSQSDAFQALVFSLSLFEATKSKVFIRNLVLISCPESPLGSLTSEKINKLPNVLAGLRVNLITVGLDLSPLASNFASYKHMSADQASHVAKNVPPLRKTRPVSLFRGGLRLGANINALIRKDYSYDASDDDNALCWTVELYPAAKKDNETITLHEYIYEDHDVAKVEKKTTHFVWEKNEDVQAAEYPDDEDVDDRKFDKIPIESTDFTPGFKFSNFDLLALDQDLMAAAKLELFSALDIVAFLPSDKIPYAYFTGEALHVLPANNASYRDLLSHCSFALAMLELGVSALVRYVGKTARDIEVGLMTPVKIKGRGDYCHSFIFNRLPFKQDEKIGSFPYLAPNVGNSEEKSEETNNILQAMDEFVESKTLEDDDKADQKAILDHYKVTMKNTDSTKLPLPLPKTLKPLQSFAPGPVKFSRFLRKLVDKSLTADNLESFLADPDIIKKVISDEKNHTNFYNLENFLLSGESILESWISQLNQKARPAIKRLRKALGVEFVRKEDLKKQKPEKKNQFYQPKGNYGADEGNYAEVPDFDF